MNLTIEEGKQVFQKSCFLIVNELKLKIFPSGKQSTELRNYFLVKVNLAGA